MRLKDFISRVRDDAARFRVAWERQTSQNPTLFPEELSLGEWLRHLTIFMVQEARRQMRRQRTPPA